MQRGMGRPPKLTAHQRREAIKGAATGGCRQVMQVTAVPSYQNCRSSRSPLHSTEPARALQRYVFGRRVLQPLAGWQHMVEGDIGMEGELLRRADIVFQDW